MAASKSSKMLRFINCRVKVTIQDSRVIVGKFMAFDKHMNLVLGDAEEFRKVTVKGKLKEEREEKRTLGLVLLRGETVVSLSVEGPPIEENKGRVAPNVPGGPGLGRAVARGMAIPPPSMGRAAGLSGPVRGVGGPAPGMMLPQQRPAAVSAPISYGAPPPGMRGGPGMPPGMPPGMSGMPPGMPPRGGVPPPGMPPGAMPPGMPPRGFPMPPGMPPGVPPGMRPPPGMPPVGGVPPGMPPIGLRPGMPGMPPGMPGGMPPGMPPGMPGMPPGAMPPGMPPRGFPMPPGMPPGVPPGVRPRPPGQ